MFKIFVTVDKNQGFKSLTVEPTLKIRLLIISIFVYFF